MKAHKKTIWFLFFLILLVLFPNVNQVNATVTSAVPHGEAYCPFALPIPSTHAMAYSIYSPPMMEIVGSHVTDDYNQTFRSGSYTVNAPYDGYVVYLDMQHFYWFDSNVTVSAPGFYYNVTAWNNGNGGLFTDPTRGCSDNLKGHSRYKVTLSAGTTTFTVSTKNHSYFYIYAPPNNPPNPPPFSNVSNYQKLNHTNPHLYWHFRDPNVGDYQTAYQIVGSKDGWATWHYNSGEVVSGATNHAMPYLGDGNWNFAVRTRDSLGNWSTDWGYVTGLVLDSTKPTYTSYTPTGQHLNVHNSFRLEVNGVTDNLSGIQHLQAGVWTQAEGVVNAKWYPLIHAGNGVWYVDIPTANHQNYEGSYYANIYLYDQVGNQVMVPTITTVIDRMGPTIDLSRHTEKVLYNSNTEKRGANEFLKYDDIAPLINTYGLIPYVISFDIKADVAGSVWAYQQNGSGAKYDFFEYVDVTTNYTRKHITVTPTLSDVSQIESFLSFYGEYGSGRIINVKNVQIHKKEDYWTREPITINASAIDSSGVQSLALTNQSSLFGRNYAVNGDFSKVRPVFEGIDWDKALHGNIVPSVAWCECYNSGVPDPTVGYHAHLDTSLGVTAFKYPNKNEQFGHRNRWLGINQWFENGSALESQLSVGQKVTVSFDLFSDKIGGDVYGGFYRNRKSSGTYDFYEYGHAYASRSYMWERKSFTITIDSDWDFNKGFFFYLYGSNEDNETTKWIKNVKVELGEHATPYTKAIEDIEPTTNPKSYQVAGNGTYHFTATDIVGNVSTSSINVSHYDNTPPTLHVTADKTTLTKDDVTITASASDSQSGVKSVRLHKISFDKNIVGLDDFENWRGTSFVKSGSKVQFKNEDVYDAGIKLSNELFEEGKEYVLNFDMTKLSGEVPFIGGHGYFEEDTLEVFIDGSLVEQSERWGGGVSYPNDNQKHHVTLKFKIASLNEWDKNVYIQPNRGNYGTYRYEVLFENIQLEEGTEETPYTPSTKDAFSKANPGKLVVNKNGTYEFIATDHVGNTTIQSIEVANIDQEKPVITFTPETLQGHFGDIDVQIDIIDKGIAGYKQYRYAWSKGDRYPTAGWSEWDETGNPIISQTGVGKWYLHIEAMDHAGNIAYAMSGSYEKLALSSPSVNINVSPMPTGVWVNQPIDVYIMESGDDAMLTKARKFYEVTNSSLLPSSFTNTIPADKKVRLNLVGENFIHVHYVLEDGTKIYAVSGPYLIDTGTIGDFEMKLQHEDGTEVTGWSNKRVQLVMTNPANPSISGYEKQYRMEGIHTEWQRYTEGMILSIEGKHRTFGRIVNKTGEVSEQKSVYVQIDQTNPTVQLLRLEKSNDTDYRLTAKATDHLSGIQKVSTDKGAVLSFDKMNYQLTVNGIKPNALIVEDIAGNKTTMPFATEPVITFQAPYAKDLEIYREDVIVEISGAKRYVVGNRSYECTSNSCSAKIGFNAKLTAIQTEGIKITETSVVIDNIDKKEHKLTLHGKRNNINPRQIELTWNYPLQDAVVACTEDGEKETYIVTGKSHVLNGKNYMYHCSITGIYKTMNLASNVVSIYPTQTIPLEGGYLTNERIVNENVSITETRIGKLYMINGKQDDYKYDYVPVPDNDVTKE